MPTEVWTASDLDNVRNDLAGNYIQMADIDMAGFGDFTPIGDIFTGVYDGNNKTIDNLTIIEDVGNNTSNTGLFRRTQGSCEIKNVRFTNCYILGGIMVGGLVAYPEKAIFENIIIEGEVAGYAFVGGIVGETQRWLDWNPGVYDTQFYHCHFRGVIRGPGLSSHFAGIAAAGWGSLIVHRCSCIADFIDTGLFVGGIGGEWSGQGNDVSSITETYAKINVYTVTDTEGQWMQYAGGIAGRACCAHLENCYSRMEIIRIGDASPTDLNGYGVSGLVGQTWFITIINCYSASIFDPEIWHPDYSSHSVVIYEDDQIIINSYTDSEIANTVDTSPYSMPEFQSRTTAEMVYPYTDKHVSGTFVDWEFENKHITDLTDFDFVFGEPWKHDPTFTLNDGYPQFEGAAPVVPTLTKIADCYTPTNPLFSVSLDYGPFNNTVMERQDTMIAQYRFTNPPTGHTLKTKWRYLTPKIEHNVICGFECRGILIRFKLKGKKPKLIPEFE